MCNTQFPLSAALSKNHISVVQAITNWAKHNLSDEEHFRLMSQHEGAQQSADAATEQKEHVNILPRDASIPDGVEFLPPPQRQLIFDINTSIQ